MATKKKAATKRATKRATPRKAPRFAADADHRVPDSPDSAQLTHLGGPREPERGPRLG